MSNSLIKIEDDRTGTDIETLRRAFLDNLFYVIGKYPEIATLNDNYLALAFTVRDRLLRSWLDTQRVYHEKNPRTVGYLSAEFLLGPHLGNNLTNLGLYDKFEKILLDMDMSLSDLLEQEEEPGLGNGGLGRLAACYLDSLATLDFPAIGYGIRYEFGMFDQAIADGWQIEKTDKWLRNGNPWEVVRIEDAQNVMFGGYTEHSTDTQGRYIVNWIPTDVIKGVPYDTPILGYATNTTATLRLWKAEACEDFDYQTYNSGDFYGAVRSKISSENISKILYPNDLQAVGKELRLKQQYFFVSCSIQDVMKTHLARGNEINTLHEKFSLQLNDTHPSIAIPELMRLLIDQYQIEWDEAWIITQKSFGYTNHTLMPEAMEKWPLNLMRAVLPRHLEIILEINRRFLDDVKLKHPKHNEQIRRLSIIDESGERYVKMANLACVGSHSINGVSKLHSDLLRKNAFSDFNEIWPEKLNNKTNGVTPRRWLLLSNRPIADLISKYIGDKWIKNLGELKQLEQFSEDSDFIASWQTAKSKAKANLAQYIFKKCDNRVDVNSLFDVQVKRFHEYKRQHLNVLHIITLYNRLKDNPELKTVPRTFIFGGKAAPGYEMAKLIIKLVNSIGKVINNDPDVNQKMNVLFLPNFNVSSGQLVYPAADLSEQISTAGMEASGTGNMKLAMNGALTIGTLDGANIEIRDKVGYDNFFLFGHTSEEIDKIKTSHYDPMVYYNSNKDLRRCLDMISSGMFSNENTDLFKPLVDSLLQNDNYFLLADYQSYIDCQRRVGELYLDMESWTRKTILNVARIGEFSSDRSIMEYCSDIWNVDPIDVRISPKL